MNLVVARLTSEQFVGNEKYLKEELMDRTSNKIFVRVAIVVLVSLSYASGAFAETTQNSTRCDCINFAPIIGQDGIEISFEIQQFVAINALVNPERLFISTKVKDESGNFFTTYRPLNGLIFRNMDSYNSKRIHKYFSEHKDALGYSWFWATSDSLEKTQNLLITKGHELSGICSYDFLEMHNYENEKCIWNKNPDF